MSDKVQFERTVQPGPDERKQTDPYQKTRDLIDPELNAAVKASTEANPSLANTGAYDPLRESATEETGEKTDDLGDKVEQTNIDGGDVGKAFEEGSGAESTTTETEAPVTTTQKAPSTSAKSSSKKSS